MRNIFLSIKVFPLRFFNVAFLTALIIMSISGCKKDYVTNTSSKPNKSVYDKLVEVGFPKGSIKEHGDYLVIGDYIFHKTKTDTSFINHVFRDKKNPISLMEKKNQDRDIISQARHNILISTDNSQNISVFYDHTAPEMSAWSYPLAEAMKKWSEVTDSKVNFNLVWYETTWENPVIDIVVTDDDGLLDGNVIAGAEWPEMGRPGFRIRINTDFNNDWDVPYSTKLYNMVHELGHCLGLLHTNSSYPAELHITGTPAVDASSVMNGGTALNSWNGLSNNDKIAIQNLYPHQVYDKWITYPEGKFNFDGFYWGNYVFSGDTDGAFPIQWNSSLVNTNTVSIELYEKGKFKGLIAQNIPNSGSFSFSGNSSYLPYRSYPSPLRTQIQIKLISGSNPSVNDFSSMFMIKYND